MFALIASATFMINGFNAAPVISPNPAIDTAKVLDGHRRILPTVAAIFKLCSHENLSKFFLGEEYAIFYIIDCSRLLVVHAYGNCGINIRFEQNDFGQFKFHSLTVSGRRIGPFKSTDVTIPNR